MDLLTVHGHFSARPDGGRALLPEIEDVDGLELGLIPALATAAASLSGMLDGCRGWRDLVQAVRHFNSLLRGGVVSPDEWAREGERVVCEVLYWGDVAATN